MDSLKLNSKIDLITKEDKKVAGLIHDIDGDRVFVSVSADDKDFILLSVGDELKCIISDSKSTIGFDAVMSGRVYTKEQFPIYELSSIENIQKIQRRGDVRVTCSLPVRFSSEESIQDKSNPLKEASEGIIINLSAGGLRISCYEDYSKETILHIRFSIEKDEYQFRGKIVYKNIIPLNNRSIYQYGIKFMDISENQRDKIIQYLFVLMRKNRMR